MSHASAINLINSISSINSINAINAGLQFHQLKFIELFKSIQLDWIKSGWMGLGGG